MKIKDGFILREMSDKYIVVTIGEASKQFNGMIHLNEAGAYMWRELEKGLSEDELVQKLLARYEGIDENEAREEVRSFTGKIEVAVDK